MEEVSSDQRTNPTGSILNNMFGNIVTHLKDRIRFYIGIVTILLFIILGYYLFRNSLITSKFGSQQKDSSSSITSSNAYKKLSYRNDYWGFEVKFPKGWYAWESKTGNMYYFTSYDSRKEEWLYKPQHTELRIKMSVLPRDMGPNYKGIVNSKYIVKENVGQLIDGEKSTEIQMKYPELTLFPSGIDERHYAIQYVTVHEGFTYIINAEPANSLYSNEYKDFIANFKFIKRLKYLSRSEKPLPGNTFYEDKLVGFTFQYPIEVPFRPFPDIRGGSIDGYGITLWLVRNIDANTGKFEEDIRSYALAMCGAGGPTGIQYCPEEDARIEEFISKNNIKGIKVYRKVVVERGTTITRTYNDVAIAFPIDTPEYFGAIFTVDDLTYADKLVELADTFKYLEKEKQ